jgi:hypothetical protein
MVLNDGLLEFQLTGKGKQITASVDLLVLELACNELLQKMPLQVFSDGPNKGRYISTSEFTFALAKKLQPFIAYSEPHTLTPSQAHEIWAKCGEMVADVKKNTAPTLSLPSGTASTPLDSAENNAPGCC